MAINGLTTGNKVVLKLRQNARFKKAEQTILSPLQGEVEIKIEDASQHGADVSLVRLGLYGPGHADIGAASLRGLEGTGVLDGAFLHLDVKSGVTYNALEIDQFDQSFAVDHFGAKRETFDGQLQIRFQDAPGAIAWPSQLERLFLQARDQSLGLIDGLESDPSLAGSIAVAHRLDPAGLPCAQPFRSERKRLLVRAVFFKAAAQDPSTGSGWPEHLKAAQAIWRKCGIEIIEAAPPHSITDALLRAGEQPMQVVFSHMDEPGTILLFFVAGTFTGPGWTWAEGAAHARCIISDLAASNVNIVAHELGHVLDGDDSGGSSSTTTWTGERCTVMMPNSVLTAPILERNTLHNCQSAKNDAIGKFEAICLVPDPSAMSC